MAEWRAEQHRDCRTDCWRIIEAGQSVIEHCAERIARNVAYEHNLAIRRPEQAGSEVEDAPPIIVVQLEALRDRVIELERILGDVMEREQGTKRYANEVRKMIVDSASVCTIKGCEHCKWLGFNLGRYESLMALAQPARGAATLPPEQLDQDQEA